MTFSSILYQERSRPARTGEVAELSGEPEYFKDLNLDQVFESVIKGKAELKPLFYPTVSKEDIQYRHEIFLELETGALTEIFNEFTEKMVRMRARKTDAENYPRQKDFCLLDSIAIYCEAVRELEKSLGTVTLNSSGLNALREYLSGYVKSQEFQLLLSQSESVRTGLLGVRYCLFIQENSVKVRKPAGEPDYGEEVRGIFARFQRDDVTEEPFKFSNRIEMNDVEAGILDLVAQLYPDEFAALNRFSEKGAGALDEVILKFDLEIQFYLSFLNFIVPLKEAGLSFCYPEISDSKAIATTESFDIGLADRLEGKGVVCNDFHLDGEERIMVVTGPNQGGKTTFARMFGQLHHLAAIGCPIPGQSARLYGFDRIFCHFEREENIDQLHGKLKDDLIRIHHILNQVTSRSLIIMNEIFTSTTLEDAIFLSKNILQRVIKADALGLCTTFIDELTSLSPQTVSMVSAIDDEESRTRTFKIVRRPSDGLAYAMSIAQKHQLTYQSIKERIHA
jgi:DNA mismatch repair protein MutS